MFSRLITTLAVLSIGCAAGAEYRVFELEITDQKTGLVRKVKGTLDDIQYRGYYPVAETEEIKIADTWVCHKNRTENYRTFCPSPRAPASPVLK